MKESVSLVAYYSTNSYVHRYVLLYHYKIYRGYNLKKWSFIFSRKKCILFIKTNYNLC